VISVVVPTRNRHEPLERCLRALAAERPDGGLEVILVNDGGDPLPPALANGGLDVRVIDQSQAGPSAARNAGAAAARGPLLVFTDDDCEAAPGWLAALERRLAAEPDAVVGGREVSAHPDNTWATASQVLIDHLQRWYNRDPRHARFVTSNNLAMSAETFEALGGFHTGFPDAAAEDRELADRVVRSGRGLVYEPRAVVRHRQRLTGRTFLRQHYGYGRGAYRLLRVRRAAGDRMIFEPPRFYAQLLAAPLSKPGGREGLLLGALVVLSQLAHTAGFVSEALSRD
jgi:glycosyltransferase involved in cell wall biosynthesis